MSPEPKLPRRSWAAGLVACLLVVAGCDGGGPSPGGDDASVDDASVDAGAVDAASGDAGPVDARMIDAPIPTDDRLIELCGAMPTSFDDWENCYQKRKCEWRLNCGLFVSFAGVDECIRLADAESGGQISAEFRERRRAHLAKRMFINEPAFRQCLEETSPSKCPTALLNDSCATRFIGTVKDGGSCYSDVECRSPGFPEPIDDRNNGAHCVRTCTDDCCVGSCRPAPKEGEACSASALCEPGLWCAGAPPTATCVSGDLGTPCRFDSNCDREYWCDQVQGRCVPDLPLGSACEHHVQCSGEAGCAAPRGMPRQCRRLTEPGDPCEDICFGNLECAETRGGGPRTCHALPASGVCNQFCDSVTRYCDETDGICKDRQSIRDACRSGTCQPGLFCTTELGEAQGHCEAPGAVGARCSSPSHCASFLCGNDGTCKSRLDSCPVLPLSLSDAP